jgi:predicted outer membrane protein
MKNKYLFVLAALVINTTAIIPNETNAQKVNHPVNKTTLTATDRLFVQDAINRNNEAMALAQAALQQSQKKEVQQIARQFMTDHRAAQKKLYTIAGITDTVPYSHSVLQPSTGISKLPTTDNLDNRRNRTVVSIIDDNAANKTATNTNATNTNNTNGNTIAGTANTQRQNGFDTTSRFGVNQPFNGNTSIDNANGVNNSNRTDVASYNGRYSETNTVANSQNPVTTNQQTNVVTNNSTNTTTGNINATTATASTTNNAILPDFPTRVIDTVRQTGSTAGFQNPGTNLSFPGNERYSKTTPATAPNSNAGSDYGVTGVPINNAQTNALNTAPYSNNDINSHSVQTGRVLPTSDPAAVINSSTASMRNKDVGFNNANTGSNGVVQQNGQLAADNANGINRRTSEVINSNSTSSPNTTSNTTVNNTTSANTNNGAILAGRSRSTSGTVNTQAATTTTNTTAFYTEPFAASSSLNTLNTTPSDAFDAQWATQMNVNQQAAVTLYQSVLRKVTNTQVKAYINTVLPLLRGHQFAIRQWQAKQ